MNSIAVTSHEIISFIERPVRKMRQAAVSMDMARHVPTPILTTNYSIEAIKVTHPCSSPSSESLPVRIHFIHAINLKEKTFKVTRLLSAVLKLNVSITISGNWIVNVIIKFTFSYEVSYKESGSSIPNAATIIGLKIMALQRLKIGCGRSRQTPRATLSLSFSLLT